MSDCLRRIVASRPLIFNSLRVFSGRTVWLGSKRIPVRGKHLDDLMTIDRLFIAMSKAATGPFVYFYLRYAYFDPNISWSIADLSFQNTALALVALFIIYDFFYTILHWALHIKSIYGFVHKHHHRQLAPSRGSVDAVNVHPLEYFLGEYNHLLALFLCSQLVIRVHFVTALLFLAIGGILAGINHTRFDVTVSIRGVHIYDSKAHDVHHRIPQSNYGQYTMFWDWVFGTYRYVAFLVGQSVPLAVLLTPCLRKAIQSKRSHQS